MKEKKDWYRVAIWLAILGLVIGFGFFSNEPEYTINPIYGVKEYNTNLYWAIHPFKFLDGLGLVLFSIGTFAIVGAYKPFFGEQGVKKGELGFLAVAAVVVAAGIGLCFI